MRIIWSLGLLPAVFAHAQVIPVDKRPPLRFVRRGQSFANTTTSTSLSNATLDATLSSIITDQLAPTTYLPSDPFAVASSTSEDTTTVDPLTCTGSITYYGSVPPTVYVTVTEGFNVTVTASNVSVTETPTLITPLPACQATIMPLFDPGVQLNFSSSSDPSIEPMEVSQTGIVPAFLTSSPPPPPPHGVPPEMPVPEPPESKAPVASSAVYSSVGYTSTVIVTKKTPATVVVPLTAPPDVNFQSLTSSLPITSTPKTKGPAPGANSGGDNGGDGSHNPSSIGNNNSGAPAQSGDADLSPGTSSQEVRLTSVNGNGATPSSTAVEASPTTNKLGDIITSIIYSPFGTASPTGRTPAKPFTTTISSIPIVILPSSVVVGSQTVAIPTSASTTVEADGATFTVRPSEVIAPDTTISITPAQQVDGVTTSGPASTVITANDHLTLTIGPTVAIILGTTYRIGQGAPATTITVDGTTISVGSQGVGLPGTALDADGITQTPYAVYTAEGLTLSVDSSEAVIGGTTYRIGSDAPQLATTISSQRVSFGPAGVGLGSTTIAPTAASSSSAGDSPKSTTAAASATQSTVSSNGASFETKVSALTLSAWHLVAFPMGWLLL